LAFASEPDTIRLMLTQLGLFLLSAATLAFEINLTRLFSVAQFYHFAFMIVSLALLGFGASGSALALFPGWGRQRTERALGWLALGFAVSSVGSYMLINRLPFDSFSIAWDRRQVGVLALHYLALATPFFCSGAAVGLLLSARPNMASRTYFVNLIGSAAGCLVAFGAAAIAGGEGIVILSSGLAALAGSSFWFPHRVGPAIRAPIKAGPMTESTTRLAWLLPLAVLVCSAVALALQPPYLAVQLSPYKDLSYALNVPGAEVLSRRWNAYSRVDLVESPAIRSLPGLSYRYSGLPPRQRGLTVDGSDLSGVVVNPGDMDFVDYLPGALAYRLRPEAAALLLEPHGGLDILVADGMGAQSITAVEPNPLVVEAASSVYDSSGVQTVVESGRSYARRTDQRYDVVTLSLTAPYRPVRSGAYSLAEDYRYTVEAFEDYLSLLRPDGVLQVTRWLQTPPSEAMRLFALTIEALERRGQAPAQSLVFFRGYNTATVLILPDGIASSEVEVIREWLSARAFDLVYAPGVGREDVNRYNVLPSPGYYTAATELLTADDREAWFDAYSFDVTPPTDDHPFFGHYFKWGQTSQILREAGQTWQPFGGAGYFVLLAVLALATVAALLIILLPLAVGRLTGMLRERGERAGSTAGRRMLLPTLIYFTLIGLGFLLVEIPLAQHFILFLGQPVYGLTVVLFSLLFFSGLGSLTSGRLPYRVALAALVLVVLAYPVLLPRLFDLFLGTTISARVAIAVGALAPLGFLLGVPFPRGIGWLERRAIGLIPWAWGVNGAASVIASVSAALLALSFGFSWVLLAGALCYAGALTVVTVQRMA
jgi:hypothetical protein